MDSSSTSNEGGADGVGSEPIGLAKLLEGGRGMVLDGALATYLEAMGEGMSLCASHDRLGGRHVHDRATQNADPARADISSALWNASLLGTNPAAIQQAHASYYQAGAQIATTASYQAAIPGLTKHLSLSEAEATAYVKKSVHLARSAAASLPQAPRLLVAGSVGPYGAYLANGSEYTGAYTLSEREYHAFHLGRMRALVSAGADLLAIETIPSLSETLALASLLTTHFPRVPALFAFTVSTPTTLSDGTPLSTVLAALEPLPQVLAVGVNCVSPELALQALREMRALTRKPLVVYANSGETWDAQARGWEGEKAGGVELREWVGEAWRAGARVIGGCCRTGPAEVRVMAEVVGEMNAKVEGAA